MSVLYVLYKGILKPKFRVTAKSGERNTLPVDQIYKALIPLKFSSTVEDIYTDKPKLIHNKITQQPYQFMPFMIGN